MTTLVRPSGIKGDIIFDPSLALYLPLCELDGASFASRDAYGHLCTVTGATWQKNGRSFDNIDDAITAPSHAALQMGSGDLTIGAWFKATQDTGWNAIVTFGGGSGGGKRYELVVPPTGTAADKLEFQMDDDVTNLQTRGNFSAWDSWVFFVGTRNGVTARTYVNGNADATSDASGLGSLNSPNNRGLAVGDALAESDGSSLAPFGGDIGLVFIYNRALSPQEIEHNYLATKWRYQ